MQGLTQVFLNFAGHAYAAAISACAVGQEWQRAVALFDDMVGRAGIRPDVVSCTALVTALASAAQADKAEAVVQWMLSSGLKPNVGPSGMRVCTCPACPGSGLALEFSCFGELAQEEHT